MGRTLQYAPHLRASLSELDAKSSPISEFLARSFVQQLQGTMHRLDSHYGLVHAHALELVTMELSLEEIIFQPWRISLRILPGQSLQGFTETQG
jgi:hypothetical protein